MLPIGQQYTLDLHSKAEHRGNHFAFNSFYLPNAKSKSNSRYNVKLVRLKRPEACANTQLSVLYFFKFTIQL
jgi:hypothetical protein